MSQFLGLIEDSFSNDMYRYSKGNGRDESFGWLAQRMGYYTTIDHRSDGRFMPVYENEMDLKAIRMACWLLDVEHPTAISIRNRLIEYTISNGYDWSIKCESKQLEKYLKAAIDRVLQNSEWTELESETFHREIRDGECIGYLDRSEGDICIEIAEPENLTEPANARQLEDYYGIHYAASWSFGVLTQQGRSKPKGYHFVFDQAGYDWDFKPERRVCHWKRNTSKKAKRGASDNYQTHKWLRAGEKVLNNTAVGTAIQAAIAYIVEHSQSVPPSAISKLAAARQNNLVTKLDSVGNPYSAAKIPPGKVVDIPHGGKFHAGLLGSVQSSIYLEVLDACMRFGGLPYAMPEHMVTGFAGNNNKACHSEDTEVLTSNGWIPISEMNYETSIATFKMDDGTLEYQRPYAIHKYMHSGEMVHFKSRDVDMLVTPNHKMIVSNHVSVSVGGKVSRTDRLRPWELERADSLSCKLPAIPFNVNPVRSTEPLDEYWTLPKLSRSEHKKNFHNVDSFTERQIPLIDWVQFIGWYVSKGWTTKQTNGSYSVYLCQNEGGDANRIRSVLKKLPFSWREVVAHKKGKKVPKNKRIEGERDYVTTEDNLNWICGDRALAFWLKQNCGVRSGVKRLPDFVWGLSYEYKHELMQSAVMGYGRHLPNGSMLYFSTSSQLIDDMQRLAFECGYVAQIRKPHKTGVMSLSIRPSNKVISGSVRQRIMKLDVDQSIRVLYEGFVYCASVPNATMITRRNGTVGISGNSSDTAESPFIQSRYFDQFKRVKRLEALLLKISQMIVESSGRWIWADVENSITFSVTPPDIVSRDIKATTESLEMQRNLGWVSDRQAMGILQYDYDDVKAQIDSERKQRPEDWIAVTNPAGVGLGEPSIVGRAGGKVDPKKKASSK